MHHMTNTQERQQLTVSSPFDGAHIDTILMHNLDDANNMLKTASALFKHREGWLAHHERAAILKKLALLVEAEVAQFAMLIAQEGGKPITDARIEVARAIDGIQLAVKELSHVMRGEEIPMGHTAASVGRTAHTSYEPIGVVVAVSAFNHPLNLIVHQVVPAIAVGCPVIIKPSHSTPLNCQRFVTLVHQAGLPTNWCQICVCDNTVAEALVTSPLISFFSFIGSAKVGWRLKSKLAPGVRCALEHGGVAPAIVDKTADLTKTIPSLLKGGFYHAGQVCVSTQRIFVHASLIDIVAKELVDGANQLIVGDPTKDNTAIGPLILPREVDRVDEWVNEAVAAGATLLTGGKKLSETTYAPTILLNPPMEAKVSQLEIFGPVICLYDYTLLEEAISNANSLDFAFQAAVYTRDLHIANHCIQSLDATAVMVNDHTAFRVDWMPFAGRKLSGYGIGGIGYTMHDMVQIKMAVINQLT
jgi:acyl-CoA reductase-like NAD-dependent aldehyde dehydrogenase